MRAGIPWLWAGLVLLAGCAQTPLAPVAPSGFDLGGRWVLVPEESDPTPGTRALRPRGSMLALITRDFPALRARFLDIEQDRDSMGITYDGTEYRDVSWGTRQRGLWEVRAGWQDDRLVVISKAKDAEARETLSLTDSGRRLEIQVDVKSGSDGVSARRTFRREASPRG
jgi:hypothetical protein